MALARVGTGEAGMLRRAGTLAAVGKQNVFVTVRQAVTALKAVGPAA